MRFLELTDEGGSATLINMAAVQRVQETIYYDVTDGGYKTGSGLFFDGSLDRVAVRESPNQILTLLQTFERQDPSSNV